MRRSTFAMSFGVAVLSTATAFSLASANTRPATPAALDDPTIVAIFDGANTADIETGQLAAEHGSTKEVRDFGAMLVRDHKMVRQQGRDLAKKLGVTPTPPKGDQSAADHAAAMKKLSALHGAFALRDGDHFTLPRCFCGQLFRPRTELIGSDDGSGVCRVLCVARL